MSDELHLLPLLTVVNGPMRGASFRLRPGTRRIGREEGVDIVIDDRKVSRRHAMLDLAQGRALLVDTGSTNGTWLNDQRISRPMELRDGDRIRVGNVELRFFDPAAALTDPVGAIRYTQSSPPPAFRPADQPSQASARATAAALGAPTQAMATGRGPGRLLWFFGGGAVLAGWAAWAYLVLN
ncbi:type III secretion system (T3SS) inner membrane Yop/YscD-like protein [Micromonospora pisi]|uniref:Type III secretion system (T3SS) inner membrane Yop/YscD-like protein n=1 Tax=Micromonospora pisi TaxID=589240 RepID=A0A495JGQ4_9ACTN|nr:FHA domain-containing protein [Micromonospora pisi]RKR88063.1 type III secretion system (T3SS) inner membrane Yop/YscD-like protein [Micromonospora pisi]